MTLKEKFGTPIMRHDLGRNEIEETKEQCAEIAEGFAVGFALWKETIMQDENGLYYSESRAQISRKNPVNIQILLETYKKEKEL
jgi:hypothetical protein